ncbi:hypothetical protein HK104_007703 [Borealophlyctis nickersoniae]|nr:hypothetical protein HK104_007703 [Borealophlyctis nickersoniae]
MPKAGSLIVMPINSWAPFRSVHLEARAGMRHVDAGAKHAKNKARSKSALVAKRDALHARLDELKKCVEMEALQCEQLSSAVGSINSTAESVKSTLMEKRETSLLYGAIGKQIAQQRDLYKEYAQVLEGVNSGTLEIDPFNSSNLEELGDQFQPLLLESLSRGALVDVEAELRGVLKNTLKGHSPPLLTRLLTAKSRTHAADLISLESLYDKPLLCGTSEKSAKLLEAAAAKHVGYFTSTERNIGKLLDLENEIRRITDPSPTSNGWAEIFASVELEAAQALKHATIEHLKSLEASHRSLTGQWQNLASKRDSMLSTFNSLQANKELAQKLADEILKFKDNLSDTIKVVGEKSCTKLKVLGDSPIFTITKNSRFSANRLVPQGDALQITLGRSLGLTREEARHFSSLSMWHATMSDLDG